ncbi:MAG: flotillin-like FloA family protein [Cytophagia bacterium]|nr:flotillin-like FloA family protein [Cytophagia bacterium]
MEDYTALISVIGGILVILMFLYFVPVGLWITARFSGVDLKLIELLFMKIRRVPPQVIVQSMIVAHKAGLKVSTISLETHHIAGGNVESVIKAMIMANMSNIDLTFEQVARLDLAGEDVFEKVKQLKESASLKNINTF